MATDRFVDVPDSEPQYPGSTYRLIINVRAPYNAFNRGLIETGMRARALLTGDIRIQSIEHQPPALTAHGSNPVWQTFVTYEPARKPEFVEAGMSPRVVITMASLVLAAIVASGVLSTRLQKLIREAGDRANEGLSNLATVGLIVLGIVFFLRR